MKLKFPIAVVLWTALLAGTLDIIAAFLNSYIRSGTSPVIILQFIASGVLGIDAFKWGYVSAFIGLLFHYSITFMGTLIFFTLYPKFKIYPNYKIISGLVYGIIIWLVMNLIVLPLSNTRDYSSNFGQTILGIAFIMFLIGLPISLSYYKYYKKMQR